MTRATGLVICGVLLVLFAVVAGASVLTKSATADEPSQSVAGWVRLYRGDFRMDLSNPPLWNEWAALANGPSALRPPFDQPLWDEILKSPVKEQKFSTQALYETPGIDGAAFVNRARLMMLAFGVLLGVLIAAWAWQLRGPIAAVVALAFFALDPNFLAHAPLVKNDVAVCAVTIAGAWFLWRLGRRFTLTDALGLCATAAVGPNIKLSCLALAPLAALLLLWRALAVQPWNVLGREVAGRGGRLAAVGVLCACMMASFWVCTWGVYHFRFSAAADPGTHLNRSALVSLIVTHQLQGKEGSQAAIRGEDLSAWEPDLVTRFILWGLDHEILPEGWLTVLGHVYANAHAWPTFLFDRMWPAGVWYYFPLALLFKTPVVTLAAALFGAIAGVWLWRGRARDAESWWSLACVLLPALFFFVFSLQSHLDIGVRFELPVYPFLFVALGVVAAGVVHRWGARARWAGLGVIAALAIESLSSAPNFLCFFNAAVRGPKNGIALLGDSNLDWGQDLPALARWQQQHPNEKLYLAYFGMADPAFYGIRYRALPGNYMFGPPVDKSPEAPAVVAISASNLQGIPMATNIEDTYAKFRDVQPREVLNGTIYLFDL